MSGHHLRASSPTSSQDYSGNTTDVTDVKHTLYTVVSTGVLCTSVSGSVIDYSCPKYVRPPSEGIKPHIITRLQREYHGRYKCKVYTLYTVVSTGILCTSVSGSVRLVWRLCRSSRSKTTTGIPRKLHMYIYSIKLHHSACPLESCALLSAEVLG